MTRTSLPADLGSAEGATPPALSPGGHTRTGLSGSARCPRSGAAVGQAPRPRASEASEPLENITGYVAKPGQSARREARYRARRLVQQFTDNRRLRGCGKVATAVDGKVKLKQSSDRSAGYGGLACCGRVWLCPVCSAKIAMERARQLSTVLGWNTERGGSTLLATFTIRHHKGQSLAELWHRGISESWRNMTKHGYWRKTRKELGLDHYVRATELTYGEQHGNHVHLHVLFFCNRPISQDMAEAFGARLFDHWRKGTAKAGFDTVWEAFDCRLVTEAAHLDTLSDYLVKATYNGLAYEAVGGQGKVGKRLGNRTPFQVLAEIEETGRADLIEWWQEYERASEWQRQLTWSRGLKALAGVDEVTDDEAAAAEIDGRVLLTLDRDTWRLVYAVASELLDVTEDGGVDGARAWLDARGLPYELGDTTVPRFEQRMMHSTRDKRGVSGTCSCSWCTGRLESGRNGGGGGSDGAASKTRED